MVKELQARNLWFACIESEKADAILVKLRPFLIGHEKPKPVLLESNFYSWLKDCEEELQVVLIDRKIYPCKTIDGINYYDNFADRQQCIPVLKEYRPPNERVAA